jgi:hypothetical protein
MTNCIDSPKALTRREVAALIQVTCETLSRWHAQGRGPRCVKDGRCVRYHPDKVEACSAESGAASKKNLPWAVGGCDERCRTREGAEGLSLRAGIRRTLPGA